MRAIVQCFEIPSAVDSGVNCASDVLAGKCNEQACKTCWLQGMILVFNTGVDKVRFNKMASYKMK